MFDVGSIWKDLELPSRTVQVIDVFPGSVMVRNMEAPLGFGVTTIEKRWLRDPQHFEYLRHEDLPAGLLPLPV